MKVFLYDVETDYEFDDSQTNDETDLETALDEFYNLSEEDGSFFGVIDEQDNCIQFVWEAQDKWLVDIPKPPSFLNLQKFADYDECVDIIKKYFTQKKLKNLMGCKKLTQ